MKITLDLTSDLLLLKLGKSYRFGVAINGPWSEDCNEYGAPYDLVFHHGKRARVVRIPIKNKRAQLDLDNGNWVRGLVQFGCSYCQAEIPPQQRASFAHVKTSININGVEEGLGSMSRVLCGLHDQMVKEGKLILDWKELPYNNPIATKE